MFDLEDEIKKWRKRIGRSPNLEEGDVAELEAHLRDEIAQFMKEGLDERAAFAASVEKSASPESLDEEYGRMRDQTSPLPSWHPSRFMPSLLWAYFKVALRKMRRQKGYSMINVLGLAAGLAACILILLWVQDELSYDRFHPDKNRIFRINTDANLGGQPVKIAGSPAPLAPAMMELIPEVEGFTRVQCGWSWPLHYKGELFEKDRLAGVEPSFFEFFDFPFILGDPETALRNPDSIVLTEHLARKCFGDADPLGQVVKVYSDDYIVSGVIEDTPSNTHFDFDFVLPLDTVAKGRCGDLGDWKWIQAAAYIKLSKGARIEDVETKMASILEENLPEQMKQARCYLQPLTQIHLQSTDLNTWMLKYPNKGNITYVYILSLAAICILFLACINFLSLSTARYDSQAKEVGMRKVVGARRSDLVRQFMGSPSS